MKAAARIGDDAVSTCTRLLGELGLAGEALATAACDGDLIGALAASHETRRLRAELARHPLPADAADDLDLRSLAAVVAGGRVTATTVERWHARELPPIDRLVRTPLGVACLADAMLPPTWDVSRDLVVLVGAGLEDLAIHLADLGQQRILALVDVTAAAYQAPVMACASQDELAHAVRLMHECPPDRVTVRSLDGDDRATTAATTAATANVVHQALCDLRVHHNTLSAFSATWVTQGAANLPAIARWPSVADVGDRFEGRPMIICAPGPSLAGNVAQLRELRGQAIIVGFSHSLRPLRAAGVVPDLVLTVDPQDVRYHFHDGDLDGVGAVVNAVTVHPGLYRLDAVRHLTLASNGALDRWLYQAVGGGAEVPGGGSVATTALSLGLRWKCDPIIMVGLDLSFPGGRWYVDTSCDGAAHAVVGADGTVQVAGWSDGFRRMKAGGGPQAPRERVVELPGWHGDPVPSSFMFAMFHRWFVETARRVAGTVRLYNCTEGGAFIDGMEHVPLATVLAGLDAPVDVAGTLDAVQATIDPVARERAARAWLLATERELRVIERLAGTGAGLAASASAGRDDRRGDDTRLRLGKIERALAARLAAHEFVALHAQRAISDAFDEARRPATRADYLAATARLMTAAAAATAHTIALLARGRESTLVD